MDADPHLAELEQGLVRFIAQREPHLPAPTIEGLQRLGAGSSREMYRFDLVRRGDKPERRGVILRKDPPGQGLVAASDRRSEYAVIAALRDSAIPVPEVFWLEEDASVLGGPFFAMAEITGCEVSAATLDTEPFTGARESIARDKWTIMGSLARIDPGKIGLFEVFPAIDPAGVWARELDGWEATLDANALAPQPITAATIRHLRRNPPPPPARLHLVHGDFRTGNFLYGRDGRVHALLDWEMAHLGDPLEDLAWSLTVQYASADGALAGNLAPIETAIALWEEASGLVADQQALTWWRLFTTVKFQALWASGAAGWRRGENDDLTMVAAAWSCAATHEREALSLMGHL